MGGGRVFFFSTITGGDGAGSSLTGSGEGGGDERSCCGLEAGLVDAKDDEREYIGDCEAWGVDRGETTGVLCCDELFLMILKWKM